MAEAEAAARHATSADAVPILTGERVWLPVTDASFHRHYKRGDPDAPPSLRVDYLCGLSPHTEYVSFERQGYPRTCAERWWYAWGDPRRSLRRWPRRCSSSTSSIRWSRSRSRATAGSGTSSIAASGARTASSSRSTGPHCWAIETRADAARALAATPINDEIPVSMSNVVIRFALRSRLPAQFAAVTRFGSATGRRNGSARR